MVILLISSGQKALFIQAVFAAKIQNRRLKYMGKRKDGKLRQITPEEQLKYEIAEELGLLDKVMNDGWRSLSAKETGRIGGLVTKRKREMQNK